MDSESTPLAQLREATGLTGAQVAEQIGVAKTTFYTWERGERVPSVAVVPSLALALGVSVEQLVAALTNAEPPRPPRPVLHIDLRGHGHQTPPNVPTN